MRLAERDHIETELRTKFPGVVFGHTHIGNPGYMVVVRLPAKTIEIRNKTEWRRVRSTIREAVRA